MLQLLSLSAALCSTRAECGIPLLHHVAVHNSPSVPVVTMDVLCSGGVQRWTAVLQPMTGGAASA